MRANSSTRSWALSGGYGVHGSSIPLVLAALSLGKLLQVASTTPAGIHHSRQPFDRVLSWLLSVRLLTQDLTPTGSSAQPTQGAESLARQSGAIPATVGACATGWPPRLIGSTS